MASVQPAVNFERFGVAIAASFLVFSLFGTYRVYKMYSSQLSNTTQVLGAKTETPVSACLPQAKITEALKVGERTVTLYAPDKTVVLSLDSFSSCMVNTGCESGNSCSDVKTTMDVQCLEKQFASYPLALTTTNVVTRNDISVKVRKEDWTVNYKDLSTQIADAVSKEITYCQLTGETQLPKKNIANVQITVSDATPSIEGDFAKRFVEIDKSKQILYFWNDGVYQPYYIQKGARIPAQQITLRKDIAIEKLLQSIDAGYVLRNSSDTDYVVVHD